MPMPSFASPNAALAGGDVGPPLEELRGAPAGMAGGSKFKGAAARANYAGCFPIKIAMACSYSARIAPISVS